MRIEIDTKRDSKVEIIAAIRALQSALALSSGDAFKHDEILTNTGAALDSSLAQANEKPDFVNAFKDYAQNHTSRRDGYVSIFETGFAKEEGRTQQAQSSGSVEAQKVSSGETPTGFADFFSNADTESGRALASQPSNSPQEQGRTSFFKEYSDEDEKKEKVRVIPY